MSSIKPLFAAGGSELPYHSAENNCDEGLESLQLSLAPSTLEAILAAQKPEPQASLSSQVAEDSDNSLSSNCDISKDLSRKRQQLSSEDEELVPLKKKKKKKDRDKSRNRRDKRSKKHSKHKHRRSPTRSPTPERSKLPIIPKTAVFFEDVPGLKPEQAFAIDKKANKDLWNYESVSKFHIPKYKSHTSNCLGKADLFMKRPSCGGDSKDKNSRYFGKSSLRRIHVKGSRVLPKSKKNDDVVVNEFIRVPKEDLDETKSSKSLGSYSCLDDATMLYSQGKGTDYSKPQEPDTVDLVMDEIFQKVAEFNLKTREDPRNVKLWIEFVDFQDQVAQEDRSFHTKNVRLKEVYKPTKAVIEKKLAILEKALEENPSSLELKLAQLELYQDVWGSAQLEKAWEDLLFVHPSNVDLWRQYLSRVQSSLSRFSFGSMVKAYHRCFQKLIPILEGQVHVREKPTDLEEKMVDLFSQYCSFLHESGYTERAVSIYQALIEFNLFCPSIHNLSSTQQRKKEFEEFWDVGSPKFGEPSAKGWARWIESKSGASDHAAQRQSDNTDTLEDAIIQEEISRASKWLKMERLRQNAHWLPWQLDETRGETEDDCEDPDRLVLYDDISPALFKISKSESCLQIVCLFLNFLGLTSERIDQLLRLCCGVPSSRQFIQYSLTALRQTPYLSPFFSGSDASHMWIPPKYLVSFIHEILVQSEGYFAGLNRTVFTLLRFDLELLKCGASKVSQLPKGEKKELKKFGKGLLKETQNRNNLVLWETYIRLLWGSSDKMSETVSMIEVALGMFLGLSSNSEPDRCLGLCNLCKTYSQILLNFEPLEHIKIEGRRSEPGEEDKKQAMACFGALLENRTFKSVCASEVSPAFTLRIRKRFENKINELRENCLKTSCLLIADTLAAFVESYAIFEFCAANLKAANQVYSRVCREIKCDKPISDLPPHCAVLLRNLHHSQISLVTNVMHITSIPLTVLKTLLEGALEDFPHCPLLQVRLVDVEARSHIFGRLRKFFDRLLRKTPCVVTSLCAVGSEVLRHQSLVKTMSDNNVSLTGMSDTGTIHRLRSLFEQVLQTPPSRHCPLLWKLYLVFEAKYGSISRAKGVLYRGLQSCPWAKILYLEGISIFEDVELQEMTDLMVEKEIRIRMPLEEVDLLLTAEKEEDPESVEQDSEDVSELQLAKIKEEAEDACHVSS